MKLTRIVLAALICIGMFLVGFIARGPCQAFQAVWLPDKPAEDGDVLKVYPKDAIPAATDCAEIKR